MTNPSPHESQVAALISAYADRAPIDVDPVAMTHLAAGRSRDRATALPGFRLASLRLGFALLILALLVTIVGTVLMVGGRPLQPAALEFAERSFAEPFTGLPGAGAMPSTPETGELVFSFGGRVDSLGLDFLRVWLYADGRLIWKSNLEGSGRENPAFGSNEPTTAVIEQRLSPLGVELLRSEVMAAAHILGPARVGQDLSKWDRPGVLWGGLAIGAGDQVLAATWSDPRLPERLADPGSWLPAGAWTDQRVGGFVPARYYMCLWQLDGEPSLTRSELMELLPQRTKDVIDSRSTPLADPVRADCAETVSTEDARAIVETLQVAGVRPEGDVDALRYSIPMRGILELLPVLPDGDSVCNCG